MQLLIILLFLQLTISQYLQYVYNMIKPKSHNVNIMVKRLKRHLKIKSDYELSTYLGLSRNTISMWKQRKSFDYDLIMAKCPDISIDYLLTGVQPELMSERNRILNYYQIPLMQIDVNQQPIINEEQIQKNTGNKIAELEDEIKNIYKILSEKL